MRRITSFWLSLAVAAVIAGCTADVEESGSPPDVDVTGGEMPEIDVDPADVDVSTDTQVVEVPDIDVESTEP
ncbi:MAG: hypothetical protein WD737_11420 [Gemmatimonadota bacterium]